jgi:hypothetical protein
VRRLVLETIDVPALPYLVLVAEDAVCQLWTLRAHEAAMNMIVIKAAPRHPARINMMLSSQTLMQCSSLEEIRAFIRFQVCT